MNHKKGKAASDFIKNLLFTLSLSGGNSDSSRRGAAVRKSGVSSAEHRATRCCVVGGSTGLGSAHRAPAAARE